MITYTMDTNSTIKKITMIVAQSSPEYFQRQPLSISSAVHQKHLWVSVVENAAPIITIVLWWRVWLCVFLVHNKVAITSGASSAELRCKLLFFFFFCYLCFSSCSDFFTTIYRLYSRTNWCVCSHYICRFCSVLFNK